MTAIEQRRRRLVRAAVDGRPGPARRSAARRTHEAAHEAVPKRSRPARGRSTDGPPGRSAVLAGLQRAPAVGQRFGQHGHDPVREVDRVAALVGGRSSALCRPHVVGHVGDRDHQVPAAGVVRVVVGLRPRRRRRSLARPRRRWSPGHLSRRSWRGPSRHGAGAASASASAAGRKHRGRIVLVDRDQAQGPGIVDRPARSTTRAGRGEPRCRALSSPGPARRPGAPRRPRAQAEVGLGAAVGRRTRPPCRRSRS